MNIEDQLKDLILNRYGSIREFTHVVDMSYSTVTSILKRGVGTASVTNIIKICKELGISADALADGEIKPFQATTANGDDKFDVEKIISDTKNLLTQYGFITLNGKPLSKSGIDSILDAIDVGVEMAKKKQQ